MFMQFILLLTSLISFVSAVPLVLRDVVDPPITSPTAGSVWHVGDRQTVTWSTAGLPSNPTNPNGMLVLGYNYNNSENLMLGKPTLKITEADRPDMLMYQLDSPLATNLDYAAGQAEITVPNVPTRSDYIVVLFGDSGNASPEFTIINDASASVAPTSSEPASSTPSSLPVSSPPASTPVDSSPSPITGSPTTTPLPTATAPVLDQSTGSGLSSTVVTLTPSATPSPAQTNAAWQKHTSSVGTSVSVVLALLYFVF
ncbi:hypothetical protein BS17DRAFT_843533 [Gyrodon lividus]|nr:hypothetical protein BS17DRAFT_843533 [Gyrodon lividus]